MPDFDLHYFSTFAWLLLAVAGAEVAAPYVKDTENPQKNFPRAILMTTVFIAAAYILSSIAVVMLMPVEKLTKAIISLMTNEPLRRRMGAKGRVKALKYDWSRIAQRTLDFYREVLNKSPRKEEVAETEAIPV